MECYISEYALLHGACAGYWAASYGMEKKQRLWERLLKKVADLLLIGGTCVSYFKSSKKQRQKIMEFLIHSNSCPMQF